MKLRLAAMAAALLSVAAAPQQAAVPPAASPPPPATPSGAEVRGPARARPDMVIGMAERNAILQEASDEFRKRYVFSEIAFKISEVFESVMDYNATGNITSAAELADSITSYVRYASGDKHCFVRFMGKPAHRFSSAPGGDSAAAHAQLRPAGFTAWNNYGVQAAKVLPGNIGYINLRNFAEPESASVAFAAAMQLVRNTQGLILDLRENGGGDGSMVAHVLGYFIGPKVHLVTIRYLRKNIVEESYTPESVPGPRYGDRPLYVLTGSGSFSAAEECAYDLQALKRATLIGETTGGGANPNEMVPLSLGFMLSVSTGKVEHAITRGNWEGTGVKPDIAVPEDRALKTAHVLALQKALAAQPDSTIRVRLNDVLAQVQDSSGTGGDGRRVRIIR